MSDNKNKEDINENKSDNNLNNNIIIEEKKEETRVGEKELIKEDKKDLKENNKIIEKYNNKGNVVSKPFPKAPNIDLKLKKQYKSVKKFNNCKLISGSMIPEQNLIMSGGINGHLNIYDYYSGEITKSYSLSHQIENINSINKNLIAYSSEYSIKTFNISLGKTISSFYAHETKISNLFYDEKSKNFISCTGGGIVHIWDVNQKVEIPNISHFLFDQEKIISVDYNKDSQFFYSLDEKGNFSILNIFNDEEIYIWEEENKSNKSISICSNLKNLNEFIIGYEKGFKIFDVRNFKCVEDWTNNVDFKVNKCFIDNNNVLLENELQLSLLDYKEKKVIEEKKLKDKITFFNFYNCSNNDTRIIYGDEIRNVFYSVV